MLQRHLRPCGHYGQPRPRFCYGCADFCCALCALSTVISNSHCIFHMPSLIRSRHHYVHTVPCAVFWAMLLVLQAGGDGPSFDIFRRRYQGLACRFCHTCCLGRNSFYILLSFLIDITFVLSPVPFLFCLILNQTMHLTRELAVKLSGMISSAVEDAQLKFVARTFFHSTRSNNTYSIHQCGFICVCFSV